MILNFQKPPIKYTDVFVILKIFRTLSPIFERKWEWNTTINASQIFFPLYFPLKQTLNNGK